MVRSLVYGMVIFFTVMLGAILIGDMGMAMTFGGGLGLVCLLLTPIFSVAFADGDHPRVKLDTESYHERKRRRNFAAKTLLFATPNLLGAITIFLINIQ